MRPVGRASRGVRGLRFSGEEDFVVGGVLLLTVVLFKDDEKRAVDKDATEFETIICILLEERMNSRVTKEKKSIKNFFTSFF